MSSSTDTTTNTTPPSSQTLHYADDPSRFPMEGGCSCGQTRYRLLRAPLVVHCCHCTACQRETGSAFAVNMMTEARHVVLLGPAAAGPTLPASPSAPDVFPPARPLPLPLDNDDKEKEKQQPPPQQPNTTSTTTTTNRMGMLLLQRATLPQESGDPQTVSHCATCLTAVWAEYGGLGPSVLFVRGGTLDRAWLVRPDVHLFVRSKRDFVVFGPDDKTPRFEGYYDRRHVWRAESLKRWDEVVMPGILKGREEEEEERRRRLRGKEPGTAAAGTTM